MSFLLKPAEAEIARQIIIAGGKEVGEVRTYANAPEQRQYQAVLHMQDHDASMFSPSVFGYGVSPEWAIKDAFQAAARRLEAFTRELAELEALLVGGAA